MMKHTSQVLRAITAAFALFLSTQAANAQQACSSHDEAMLQLEKQFSEQVAGRGLATNGKQMLELLVSETGSWTVLVSDPRGRSCVVASGENWQAKTLVLGDPA